jgi:hypothetical protein
MSILKSKLHFNRREEEAAMCDVQIQLQCYDRFFEVSSDEVEFAELAVEEIVSQVLVDLFGGGTVDDVTIRFSSSLRMGLQHCSIQIHAQCSCQHFVLLPRTREKINLAIEKSLCSILKELFVSVKVDSVMLNPSPWDYGNDLALFRSIE